MPSGAIGRRPALGCWAGASGSHARKYRAGAFRRACTRTGAMRSSSRPNSMVPATRVAPSSGVTAQWASDSMTTERVDSRAGT